MKRLLTAATSVAALVAVMWGSGFVTSPAGAVDPSTPVYDGLPADWAFDWVPFASPDYGPSGEYQHVAEAAPTGWGTGALKLVMGPVSGVRLTATKSLAGLAEASVWVKIGLPAGVAPSFDLLVVVDGTTYVGALPTDTTWTKVDLATLPLVQQGPGTSTTLTALSLAHPTTATLTFSSDNTYDAGGAYAYVDGWTWTANGATEAYDFEDAHTPVSCGATVTKKPIVAGAPAMLRGLLSDGTGAGVPGEDVVVHWRTVGRSPAESLTTTTDDQGEILLGWVNRLHTTEFWIDHPQTDTLGRCISDKVSVHVRTSLTLTVQDKRLRRGDRIVADGRSRPTQRGTKVSLWRVRPGKDTVLDTGKLSRKGTYRLAAPAATSGRWRVYVTVAAARGNLAGTSPTVNVRVT